jgi:hypothetical protein
MSFTRSVADQLAELGFIRTTHRVRDTHWLGRPPEVSSFAECGEALLDQSLLNSFGDKLVRMLFATEGKLQAFAVVLHAHGLLISLRKDDGQRVRRIDLV